jgi:hypothetical protein
MDYDKLTEDGIKAFVREFTTGAIEVTTVTNLYMGGYNKGYADGVRDCQKAGAMNDKFGKYILGTSAVLMLTLLCMMVTYALITYP